MKGQRAILKRQRAECKEKLSEQRAYLKELEGMCKTHGTESSVVEAEVTEAKHNIKYYETQIEQLKQQLVEMKAEADAAKQKSAKN